ncbi:MAG: hypothetical protein NTX65_00715 [Ignavibacteriales bacterium]|nr:hypothetical protein [Ignavibacteriales bacterium]
MKILLIFIFISAVTIHSQNKSESFKNQGKKHQKQKVRENTESKIDSSFRVLNNEPENFQLRFGLIDELIKTNRYDEAYQQLQYLEPAYKDDEKFKSQFKIVTDFRDSTFNREVEHYTVLLKENPLDKEAVMKLAAAYGNLLYYNSAIEILEEFLQSIPEDQDLDARFKYSQYCAWNYEWEKATSQIDKLLELDPDNLDYQLLRAQICIMTVTNLDLAEKYLLNVFSNRTNDLNVLTALTNLYVWKTDFHEAEKYLNLSKQIAPNNHDVENSGKNLVSKKADYDAQIALQSLRVDANNLFSDGNCSDAFEKYSKYISSKSVVTRDEWVEYANISSCAKKYAEAIGAYSKAIDQQYDFSLSIKRAINYYYNRDTVRAAQELESLSKVDQNNDEYRLILADAYTKTFQLEKADEIYHDLLRKTNDENQIQLIDTQMMALGENYVEDKKLEKGEKIFDEINKSITAPSTKNELNKKFIFLGDAYVMNERYGDAKRIYGNLLEESQDTMELITIKERISWLPPSGFNRRISEVKNLFSVFLPNEMNIIPFSNYYSDNQKYSLMNYGLQTEAIFSKYFSLGASVTRANISNSLIDKDFTQLKGNARLNLFESVTLKGSYGFWKIFDEPNKTIGDVSIQFNMGNDLSALLSFEKNDLRMTRYSSNFIFSRINIDNYLMNLNYDYKGLFKLAGNYNYFKLGDGNEGNDFQFRISRKFFENGNFGYEYFFSDYSFISEHYYSPQNYYSHSLWSEWNWIFKNLKLEAGVKIGYVPSADFFLLDLSLGAIYNPVANLDLVGKIAYGNNPRYGDSYKNISVSLSALFGVF